MNKIEIEIEKYIDLLEKRNNELKDIIIDKQEYYIKHLQNEITNLEWKLKESESEIEIEKFIKKIRK